MTWSTSQKAATTTLLLKYIEGMIKEKSTFTEATEESSSKGKYIESMIDASNSMEKEGKAEDKVIKLEEDKSTSN